MIWICLALSLVGLIAATVRLQIDRSGTADAGQYNLVRLLPFLMGSACVWLGLTVLWRQLRGQCGQSDHHLFWRNGAVVFGVALLMRIIVLACSDAALSDDIYRYVFDGRNVANGFNPYRVKPADRLNETDEHWQGEGRIVPLLVYREMATPYMPMSQYALGTFGLAIHESWSDPVSSARVFRIGFVIVELMMIGILLCAVRQRGKSAWWVALYAWHPLPVAEIAHAGHQDIIGVALLVAALKIYDAKPSTTWLWSMALSAASMVKPVAAPVGLFMLRGRPWKDWVVSIFVGCAVAFTLALPLGWIPNIGSSAFENWYATASEMSDKWAHFAGVYETAEYVSRSAFPTTPQSPAGWNLVQERRARWVCMALLAATFIMIWRARMDAWKSSGALMLAIVLLSTTAHPWYLLWALALAPLAMSWTLWIYSLTISLGYVVFITGKGNLGGEEWTVPPSALLAGYLPVACAAVVDLLQFRRARGMMNP